jgi:hypothetical protein
VKRVLTEPSRGYNQSTIEKSCCRLSGFKKILAHFQEVLRSATRLVPISFPSFQFPSLYNVSRITMAASPRTFLCALLLLLAATLNEAFIVDVHRSSSAQKNVYDSRESNSLQRLPARLAPLFSDSTSKADGEVSPVTEGRFFRMQQAVLQGEWKDKLLKVSSYASALCVLDCTILPLVTIVLPLFGIVAGSPAQLESLCKLGHSLALWFVLPVGGLATTMNYVYSHRKLWIAAGGYLGLALVLCSNAGCGLAHGVPGVLGSFLDHWLHVLHHGVAHRVANLAGCFFLLGSNYMSHRVGGCATGPSCEHDHGHDH